MTVTFFVSSLSAGGAERVLSVMANYWSDAGHGVTVITLDDGASDFWALRPRVQRVALSVLGESRNGRQSVRRNVRRVQALRHAIADSHPDVIVSFIDKMNVLALLASLGLRSPIVVSERTHPGFHRIGWLPTVLRVATYPRASALVVQTEPVAEWARRHLRVSNLAIIPNPVLTVHVEPDRQPKNTLIAVGRLVPVKGFPLLLDAFAQCLDAHPDWFLTIIGEGPERERLKANAEELGISKRVSMPGLADVSRAFAQADIFVMTSLYEGFPNALLEAMAHGLPAISFDCPSGPSHIVRDGIDGYLVPVGNVDALAERMCRLMSDPDMRSAFSARAMEVQERFELAQVMRKWEGLFVEIGVRGVA